MLNFFITYLLDSYCLVFVSWSSTAVQQSRSTNVYQGVFSFWQFFFKLIMFLVFIYKLSSEAFFSSHGQWTQKCTQFGYLAGNHLACIISRSKAVEVVEVVAKGSALKNKSQASKSSVSSHERVCRAVTHMYCVACVGAKTFFPFSFQRDLTCWLVINRNRQNKA